MTRGAWLTTSWDDGHTLDLRLAEMLREHGIRATFYVPRSAPGGVMSESHIRELAADFEIGAHTLDHVYLTRIDDARAVRQIADSKTWVEDVTGRPCTMFCPPAGRYARDHLRMIHECGYRGIRSVELLSLDPPRDADGIMVMPTTLQAHPHRRTAYLRNAAKRGNWTNLWEYVLAGWPTDWERLAHSLLEQVTRKGGVFHLWGHSWELERSRQWERLGRVIKLMGELAADAPSRTNGELCQQFAPASPRTQFIPPAQAARIGE